MLIFSITHTASQLIFFYFMVSAKFRRFISAKFFLKLLPGKFAYASGILPGKYARAPGKACTETGKYELVPALKLSRTVYLIKHHRYARS